MNGHKGDIKDKKDIELMIRTFYASLLTNESISPVFENTDFERDMPHMISFWSFILLDEAGYTTNVFDKHIHLAIKKEYFGIWLDHFERTINSLFKGEKADLAKQRAQTIAYTFEKKLEQMGRLD
jgi:hemoglobin